MKITIEAIKDESIGLRKIKLTLEGFNDTTEVIGLLEMAKHEKIRELHVIGQKRMSDLALNLIGAHSEKTIEPTEPN